MERTTMGACDSIAVSEFERRCEAAFAQWEADVNLVPLEPILISILEHAQGHPECRRELSLIFDEIVAGRRQAPIEVVTFSMRTLRWPEIKISAADRLTRTKDPRAQSVLSDVLAVYEDEWPDSQLYAFYRRDHSR